MKRPTRSNSTTNADAKGLAFSVGYALARAYADHIGAVLRGVLHAANELPPAVESQARQPAHFNDARAGRGGRHHG